MRSNQSDLTGQFCVFGTHRGKGRGCRGSSVKQARHAVVNVAVGVGVGTGVVACVVSVACGVAAGAGIVVGGAAAGVAAHKASDAIVDDDVNDLSWREAVASSTRSAVTGGISGAACASLAGVGCLSMVTGQPHTASYYAATWMWSNLIGGVVGTIAFNVYAWLGSAGTRN